jgi:hypothetical protein
MSGSANNEPDHGSARSRVFAGDFAVLLKTHDFLREAVRLPATEPTEALNTEDSIAMTVLFVNEK